MITKIAYDVNALKKLTSLQEKLRDRLELFIGDLSRNPYMEGSAGIAGDNRFRQIFFRDQEFNCTICVSYIIVDSIIRVVVILDLFEG